MQCTFSLHVRYSLYLRKAVVAHAGVVHLMSTNSLLHTDLPQHLSTVAKMIEFDSSFFVVHHIKNTKDFKFLKSKGGVSQARK